MEWEDVSVRSRDPSVYVIDIAEMRMRVHTLEGGDRNRWFLSTFNPRLFDRKLLKSKDIEKAKYEALMLVRDRANEIRLGVTTVLMRGGNNE